MAAMTLLRLCGECARHFRVGEVSCPFCCASVCGAPCVARSVGPLRGLSRARRYAASAAFLATGTAISCSNEPSEPGRVTGEPNGSGGAASMAMASTGSSAEAGASTTVAGGASSTAGGAPPAILVVDDVGLGQGGAAQVGEPLFDADGGIVGQACEGFGNIVGEPCRVDADCVPPDGRHRSACIPTAWAPETRVSSEVISAFVTACNADEDCASPLVCGPDHDGVSRCHADCTREDVAAACTGIRSCIDDVCTPRRCDREGAVECGPGFRCDPSSSERDAVGCVALRCGDELTCWVSEDCRPDTEGASPQGCVARKCARDADCDCGYCVVGTCAPQLGYCDHQVIAMPYGCVWPDEEIV